MYTFSIHFMYTFCISNLEQLEVYKRYTSHKKNNKYTSRFHNQKTPQKVYILYTYTQSILFVGLRPSTVFLAPEYTFCIPYLVSGIYRNLTLHVNMKSQPGINSQTQAKSLFETMTGQHALLRKRK